MRKELKDKNWDYRNTWIIGRKTIANSEYKSGKLNNALKNYIHGLLAIEYDKSKDHTEKTNSIRLDLLNNIIATHIGLEQYKEGIIVSTIGLNLYPNNLKLLTRRGKCYIKTTEYEKA